MEREGYIIGQKNNYDNFKLPKITVFHYFYDFLIYLFYNFPHKEPNKEVHELCKEFKLINKTILDIGSYTGYKSFYFYSERNKVMGIDISDNMIEYANKRFRNYDICFFKGEIVEVLQSNIPDNSIDFIYCLGLTFHYDTGEIETSPYLEDVILSLVKKMKPTGILYYAFYTVKSSKVSVPITQESLSKFLNRIGISNYQMRISPNNSFNNPTLDCIIRKSEKC